MLLEFQQIKYKEHILFERGKIKPPFGYEAVLEERACFFYVVKGNYETLDPFGSIRLGSKEALLKRCGNHLSRYPRTTQNTDWLGIVVYFYPEIIKEVFKNEIPSFFEENQPAKPPIQVFSVDLVDGFMQNLSVYFDNPELMDEELAAVKLKELILLLLKKEDQSSVRKFFSEIFYPGKLDFLSTVENNVCSAISVKELAFLCNMSVSNFKRQFQKHFNDSPARYLKTRKLEKASQLLKISDSRINEIAYGCGFQDVTTFSSSFHQYFGQSPSQYRQEQIQRRAY
ncbi:MAG: helix-turn-helix transcriptional regulator [Cyclobacteriaceae bacterium]